jgi:NADH-quinone oxidoreductase subunit H
MVFVFLWIRSTLTRLRYDLLMNFAWKRLLPLGLVNIGLTAVWLTVLNGLLRG